jgi:hypothetical protein
MPTIISITGIPMRSTDERREHITEEHGELAGVQLKVLATITQPNRVLAGGSGELLAVQELDPGKFLVAVYRELEHDGFVITAFLTSKINALNRRKQVWPSQRFKST